ncbi:MAG TPA: hypothetical protein VIM33_00180 [Gaiellaceae bacterium]
MTAGATHPLGNVRVLSFQRNAIVEALGYPRLARDEFMKVFERDPEKHGFNF